MGYGMDPLAMTFLRQSVKIGTQMGLFGVVLEADAASNWLAGQEDWTRGASYTAWGVYNWVSLVVRSSITKHNLWISSVTNISR